MSVSTLTPVRLAPLSPWGDYARGDGTPVEVSAYRPSLWDSRAVFVSHLESTQSAARKVWHEAQWADVLRDAHLENELRSARFTPNVDVTPETAATRDETAAIRQAEALNASFTQREKLRLIIAERRDALRKVEELEIGLAQQREINETQQRRINILQSEQIVDGSDHRLETFWDNAAQAARDENYCGEYDRMAELMGGPGRSRDYVVSVEVTLTLNYPVNATSEDDALELLDSLSASDIESRIIDGGVYQFDVSHWTGTSAEAND